MDTSAIQNDGCMPQLLPNLHHRELTLNIDEIDSASTTSSCTIDPTDPADIVQSMTSGAVIARIEDIFEAIIDCMLDDKKQLTIQVRTRPKAAKISESEKGNGREIPRGRVKAVRFPSKSPAEARRFTALLSVLTASHEALIAGTTVTKRDIYYRDPDLFVKQTLADRCVDDIAYTLGVQRDHLNVVAAAKGLIAGSLKVHVTGGAVIDYGATSDGFLIPNVTSIIKFEPLDMKWILVIEKEATFRGLATSKYWETSKTGNGLLITAKGYPDLQTRQFLNLFCSSNPKIPIFALVDFDPDGLGIMSTYKYGSINLAHEQNATVPKLQWLGPRSTDVVRLNKHKRQDKDPQGLLQLSARDRRIALKMLAKNDIFGERGKEKEWRAEVQKMLMLNVKAEIQILGSQENMEKWLDTKLRAGKAAFKRSS